MNDPTRDGDERSGHRRGVLVPTVEMRTAPTGTSTTGITRQRPVARSYTIDLRDPSPIAPHTGSLAVVVPAHAQPPEFGDESESESDAARVDAASAAAIPAKRRRGRRVRRALLGAVVLLAAIAVAAAALSTIGSPRQAASADDIATSAAAAPTSVSPRRSGAGAAASSTATPTDATPSDLPKLAPGRTWHARPEPPAAIAPAPAALHTPPAVLGDRIAVIDARTGALLWGRNADAPAPMASTVKILTALTALRFTNPDDDVVVDPEAVAVGEREIDLVAGEHVKLGDLMGAMLVGSANDAALAVGKHVGGDVATYATAANWVAARLGARNTHVMNPHGLDQPGHLSSAHDLAILARAGLVDPDFAKWTRTVNFTLNGPTGPRIAHNKNRLLTDFPGGIGVKTGGTNLAGNCLVGAAERNGQRFIVATLHSTDPTTDDKLLLTWAFDNFATVTVASAGSIVPNTRFKASTDLVVTVPKGTESKLRTSVASGRATVTYDGRVLAETAVSPA